MSITITEALAEIKTISKRLEKKRESIFNFVGRQDGIRDPLEKDGGSVEFIIREDSGQTISVVQSNEENFRPGERVVLTRGSRTRLGRAAN